MLLSNVTKVLNVKDVLAKMGSSGIAGGGSAPGAEEKGDDKKDDVASPPPKKAFDLSGPADNAGAGGAGGPLASGEVSISTAATNGQGRMGAKDAHCYLGSPLTVAASAVAGRIADPRPGALRSPRR